MSARSENPARVRAILRDSIQNGVYPPGATLPSTRELAAQFRINRNTASKIYHELADEHVIELGVNRPPTVVDGRAGHATRTFQQRVRETLRPLLSEGRRVGLTPEETRRLFIETADDLLTNNHPRSIYLAECNAEEAGTYAQELTLKLGSIVQPILLEQLSPDLDTDIIVTPYFHMQEARDLLGHHDQRLLGLVVTAESSDIARVASAVSVGPLGVVAINLQAAERLRRLLGFQVDVPMIIAATDQPATLEEIRGNVECVACTVRAYAEARATVSDVPLVLVQYHADDQSVQHIRREIQRIAGAQP